MELKLLIIWRKNRTDFSIGDKTLWKIRGHDIELYWNVIRPYAPMLRQPPYPEILESREEIEKNINELLEMGIINKIGHKEIVEVTTPVLITWHDFKSRLCGHPRALETTPKQIGTPFQGYPIPSKILQKQS
ncbi:hypothetical protein O181_021889 [Austropuccinia psidii MF-1]|uniref:Uncharacterized protein n=1 Tax=Austropuccinia psidii MF-1 TaxID=1389203 RepID=A0A9Q3CBK1_9BASI|nr:hypothetical protein [Austropuccinia psidii MF-1]